MRSSERKKLKHDAYAETVVTGIAWSQKHQNTLVAAAVALVVIVAGTLWWATTRKQSEQSALELLEEARSNAAALPQLKEEERPDRARQVVQNLDQIAREYAGTNAAKSALLEAGVLSTQTGQPEKAITYFQQALAQAKELPGLELLARRGLATALEQAGKTEAAIAEYRRLVTEPPTPEGVQALWDLGRCYETLGRKDEAMESYRKAEQFGGTSDWAELARYRVAALSEPAAPKAQVPTPAPAPEAAPTTTTVPAANPGPTAGPTTTVPTPTTPN